MAPELIRGEPITVAADLYAVGTMLYEMLTGATPFGGGTAGVIFERHLTEPVVPPSLRCEDPTIPIALERAILRALEKAPEARQPSADALASELERAILDAPSGAEPPRRRAAFSTIAPTCDWSPLQ
jgi:serine/threonine-protein kinase